MLSITKTSYLNILFWKKKKKRSNSVALTYQHDASRWESFCFVWVGCFFINSHPAFVTPRNCEALQWRQTWPAIWHRSFRESSGQASQIPVWRPWQHLGTRGRLVGPRTFQSLSRSFPGVLILMISNSTILFSWGKAYSNNQSSRFRYRSGELPRAFSGQMCKSQQQSPIWSTLLLIG